MHNDDAETALMRFGFTQVESQIYYELLRNSPATAYRLAQKIGKAPANIYPPLKALTQKGAVFAQESKSETTSYIPVPPAQLLAGLKRTFVQSQEETLALLENVREPALDTIVSQLRSVPLVLDRARAMLMAASEIVVFDCMPRIYDLLRTEIDDARARGVEVVGLVYRAEDARPGAPFASEVAQGIEERWPGHGLILVTDATEQLIALLTRDMNEVFNAAYSDSPFLSCILHNTLVADIRLTALCGDLSNPDAALEIARLRPMGIRYMNSLADQLNRQNEMANSIAG